MIASWKESCDKPRHCVKKQRHHFVNKGLCSQGYGLSSSHVWMWELYNKESWSFSWLPPGSSPGLWTEVQHTLLEHWSLDHSPGLTSLCDSSFILLPSETFHNLHWKMALLLKIHSVIPSPYRVKCKPHSRSSPPSRTWETFHGLVSPCSSGLMPSMALHPCPRHTCTTYKSFINAKLTVLPEKPPIPIH